MVVTSAVAETDGSSNEVIFSVVTSKSPSATPSGTVTSTVTVVLAPGASGPVSLPPGRVAVHTPVTEGERVGVITRIGHRELIADHLQWHARLPSGATTFPAGFTFARVVPVAIPMPPTAPEAVRVKVSLPMITSGTLGWLLSPAQWQKPRQPAHPRSRCFRRPDGVHAQRDFLLHGGLIGHRVDIAHLHARLTGLAFAQRTEGYSQGCFTAAEEVHRTLQNG